MVEIHVCFPVRVRWSDGHTGGGRRRSDPWVGAMRHVGPSGGGGDGSYGGNSVNNGNKYTPTHAPPPPQMPWSRPPFPAMEQQQQQPPHAYPPVSGRGGLLGGMALPPVPSPAPLPPPAPSAARVPREAMPLMERMNQPTSDPIEQELKFLVCRFFEFEGRLIPKP